MDRIPLQGVPGGRVRPGPAQEDPDTGYLYTHLDAMRQSSPIVVVKGEALESGEASEPDRHGPYCTPSPAPELDCCLKCDERERYCSCDILRSDDQVRGIPCGKPHQQQDDNQAYADDGLPGDAKPVDTQPASRLQGGELQAYYQQLWITHDMYYSRTLAAGIYDDQHDKGKPSPLQRLCGIDTGVSDKQVAISRGSDNRAYPGTAVTLPSSPLSSPGPFGTVVSSSTRGPDTPVQSTRESMFIGINVPGLGILSAGLPLEDNALARLSASSFSASTNGPGSPVTSCADSLFLDGDVFSMRILPEGFSVDANALCEARPLSYSSGIDSLGNAYSNLGIVRVTNPDISSLPDSLGLLLDGCGQDVHVAPAGPGRILLFFRGRGSAVRFWNILAERSREWLLRMRLRRQG